VVDRAVCGCGWPVAPDLIRNKGSACVFGDGDVRKCAGAGGARGSGIGNVAFGMRGMRGSREPGAGSREPGAGSAGKLLITDRKYRLAARFASSSH
jgi:hypothetical protein